MAEALNTRETNGAITISRHEYEQLRLDQKRARFLLRAWSIVMGLRLPDALVKIDRLIAEAAEEGPEFEAFLDARGRYLMKGRQKN